jgi:hypothetical protein
MKCETVEIEDGNGSFVVINKDDFNSDKHKLYGDKPKTKEKQTKKIKRNGT